MASKTVACNNGTGFLLGVFLLGRFPLLGCFLNFFNSYTKTVKAQTALLIRKVKLKLPQQTQEMRAD